MISRLSLQSMRTSLNLSSRPFANHRLLWIAIALVVFVSLWLGLWVNSEKGRVIAKADEVAGMIKDQESKVEEYKKELERRSKADERIALNEQDAVQLASARQLIASKAFSWNKLIGDIERFVPNKSKVVSIQVAGASTESGSVAAQVEIKAIGQTSGQLTEMMESLEKSGGLFEVRTFTQEAAAETGEVPFTLRVTYLPNRGED
jgi:Tfp pilus assembly protein PilN